MYERKFSSIFDFPHHEESQMIHFFPILKTNFYSTFLKNFFAFLAFINLKKKLMLKIVI